MFISVLLTDGNYQNTNAILRALKSENLKVGVICNSFYDLNYLSFLPDKKFIFKTNLLKDNTEEAFEKYWKELEFILKNNQIEVFMPVGNISCRFASLYKDKIAKYCRVPVVEIDTMKIAQDKQLTFKLAERLNIPIPQTFHISGYDDVNEISKIIQFPCVIKKTNYFEGGVLYCNNITEYKLNMEKVLAEKKADNGYPIVQEYVTGLGTGYYSVYRNGECLGYFMHERIHEFPITGGASTLAKSVYHADLKLYGDKILKELKWTGVSMIEFKRNPESNELKLMEINPKFWGSLELSYVAGINFPYLNYLIAMDKAVPDSDFRREVYFRWTIPGDWLWYIYSNKEQRKKFSLLKKKIKFNTNIHWDDPLVVIHNFIHFFIKLLKTKKYPHGFIKQKN